MSMLMTLEKLPSAHVMIMITVVKCSHKYYSGGL